MENNTKLKNNKYINFTNLIQIFLLKNKFAKKSLFLFTDKNKFR